MSTSPESPKRRLPRTRTAKTQDTEKVTIEVQKYKSLVDALGDPKTARRTIFTIFIIGVLLFVGITVITLAIKRMYPYSDITTNGLGATTIKSERNEVSYWLFNTAVPWSNSGITVKEGDILTIRASGKSNTAIHHLNDAAKMNRLKADRWVGSEGEPDPLYSAEQRDQIRRKYRIFPNMNSDALVMQVVEDGAAKPLDTPLDDYAKKENFYFIGKERQNIYINNSGTLHFAVNDIILSRPTIARMMANTMGEPEPEGASDAELDTIRTRFDSFVTQQYLPLLNKNPNTHIGAMQLGWTEEKDGKKCELSYYYGKDKSENERRKFIWYDDNIGSFLIIIEKNK